MKLANLLDRIPATTVYAHCDIPCGIYSAEPARIAAKAVLRMAQGIGELPADSTDMDVRQKFVRLVAVKEREAQRCKEELLILWTDYFKPEHLAKFPDLHDTFWQAAKQCSLAKRSAGVEPAQKLMEMVESIAGVFAATEKA